METFKHLAIALLGLCIFPACNGYAISAEDCESLMSTPYTPTPAPLPATLDLPEDGVEAVQVETVNTNTAAIANAVALGATRPVLLELTSTTTVDIAGDYPWASKLMVEVVGGGAAGRTGGSASGNGGAGAGSGYYASGWIEVADITADLVVTVGAGGATNGAAGGTSGVLAELATGYWSVIAEGGALTPDTGIGGAGYSGGGGRGLGDISSPVDGGDGGSRGTDGSDGDTTGGVGLRTVIHAGAGMLDVTGAGGAGGESGNAGSYGAGGGGGAAGHWPGVNASDGGDGTSSGFGEGGGGGLGVGAGGGGGGDAGLAGSVGAFGAGARGGVRIWIY
jgi:hypothetical protein